MTYTVTICRVLTLDLNFYMPACPQWISKLGQVVKNECCFVLRHSLINLNI